MKLNEQFLNFILVTFASAAGYGAERASQPAFFNSQELIRAVSASHPLP